ncbi:MAG: acyl-CoA thioesterase [Gammaproteobacteria bacterium]
MTTQERFPWIEDVLAPRIEHGGHIDNIQITALMYGAWMNYLMLGVRLPPDVFDTLGRPTVREITGRFDAEIFPGEPLQCGVRALSRGRRSFTLREVLWRKSDQRQVASGTTVLVTVDPKTYAPVAIPDAIWSAIERAEGRAIPIAESR